MNDNSKLLEKKKVGDISLVAQKLGINPGVVTMTLKRPKSKRYKEVIATLAKVIEVREQILS